MKYAKAVRIARSIAGFSQGELADRAGLDRSYLSLIESDKRKPTTETLESISKALELPFPLLTLLAVEKEDSKTINEEQVLGLAKQLTHLLLEMPQNDDGTETADKTGSAGTKRP
jgi:XRE family transcriptional regulator, master regulator for biofilm formation